MGCTSANTPFSYGEEEKRAFRLNSMIREEGASVLKKCVANQLGVHTLGSVLNRPSIRMKIDNAQKRKIIKRTQYDLLYPGVGAVDVNTLDVTLLTFLLRELHPTITNKSKIWTSPSPGDFSMEADSTRLRELRNKFSHEGSSNVTERDFNTAFSDVRNIICRLARNSGYMDFAAMSDLLENKKIGTFERKPSVTDQSTSVSSSLETNVDNCGNESSICVDKQGLQVNAAIDNEDSSVTCTVNSFDTTRNKKHGRYFEVEVIDPAGSWESFQGSDSTIYETPTPGEALLTPHTKDVGTCNLQPKRKLSIKMRNAIKPFIRPPVRTMHSDRSSSNLLLPKRLQTKQPEPRNAPNTFCTCLSFKSRFREHSTVMLSRHSDLKTFRCQITGMVCDKNKNLFIADCVHNSVQVFDAAGRCLDEYKCPQPSGVCLVSPDVVAVSHRTGSFVELIRFDILQEKLELTECIHLKCGLSHYEIKCDDSYIYILCENGSLHYINKLRKHEIGVIRSGVITEQVNSFDVHKNYIFLSTKAAIFCVDHLGSLVWRFDSLKGSTGTRERPSFEGLTVMNKRLYVAQWSRNTVLRMTLSGGCLAEVARGALECPFKMTSAGNRLWVSQYSSDLDHEVCRTIVQLKR